MPYFVSFYKDKVYDKSRFNLAIFFYKNFFGGVDNVIGSEYLGRILKFPGGLIKKVW